MAETSRIAWTRSTFNPWIGCTKVGPGCDHCYAETLDKRHNWGGATHWGAGVPRHRTSAHYWTEPLRWNRLAADEQRWDAASFAGRPGFWPVFCASLADVFDNEVPEEWREDLFRLICQTQKLTWLLLTKRIGNAEQMMARYVDFDIPNVWLGISVVNQEEADRDIPKLLATPAAKRFVSYEPALGPVDFSAWLPAPVYAQMLAASMQWTVGPEPARYTHRSYPPRLDWVICGAESGPNARPMDLAWARSTITQCHVAGIPCFIKQDNAKSSGEQGRFTDEEWAIKEFP